MLFFPTLNTMQKAIHAVKETAYVFKTDKEFETIAVGAL